jgi:hypothetical protein
MSFNSPFFEHDSLHRSCARQRHFNPLAASHGFGKVSKLSDESAQEREFPQPRQGDFAFGILLALLRVAVLLGEGYAHLWRLSNIWLFRVVWGERSPRRDVVAVQCDVAPALFEVSMAGGSHIVRPKRISGACRNCRNERA